MHFICLMVIVQERPYASFRPGLPCQNLEHRVQRRLESTVVAHAKAIASVEVNVVPFVRLESISIAHDVSEEVDGKHGVDAHHYHDDQESIAHTKSRIDE